MTLTMEKAPTFTTATACKSALTGVGATIAAGSHEWTGMIPALANPNTNISNNTVAEGLLSCPEKIPPAANSRVPVA